MSKLEIVHSAWMHELYMYDVSESKTFLPSRMEQKSEKQLKILPNSIPKQQCIISKSKYHSHLNVLNFMQVIVTTDKNYCVSWDVATIYCSVVIHNYLYCFVSNYDVFKYLVISNVFVKLYIAWKLKLCFILIIAVIVTCRITYLSPLQMCF